VDEPSPRPVEALGYHRGWLLAGCLAVCSPVLILGGAVAGLAFSGDEEVVVVLLVLIPIVAFYALMTGLWYAGSRKRRLRLDAHGVTIMGGLRSLGSWQTVPWGDVVGVERTRWGLRIHTAIGWHHADLPRFKLLRGIDMGPVLPHDDAYRTVMAWWRAYGNPPPPAREPWSSAG
jgi:hypothetical protein